MPYPTFGDHELPTPEQALATPLRDWPSWWIRMECSCGRERYANQVHLCRDGLAEVLIGDLVPRIRHKGCDGRPVVVELTTAIPHIEQRPDLRRIKLIG